MTKHFDTVIVGAGSMGMAAGYYLTKQGKQPLLIDAFDPPHVNGSHHGDTRIIRHAYGEGRQYVPLALRAQELWQELEQVSGRRLFIPTGVLSIGAPDCGFIDEVITSAQTYGLPLEVLSSVDVQRRWPGIVIPEDFSACLEPTSGVLFSEECIRAFRQLAVAQGATLMTNTIVKELEFRQQGVIVRTESDVFQADSAIISAGAWAKKLLSAANLQLPLAPTRKTVAWFEADEQLYRSDVFPAFIIQLIDEMYYGFPSIDGCGVKIGRHDGGPVIDPDTLERVFGTFAEDEGDVRRTLQRFMPDAAGKLNQGRVCIYTFTPDEHFIIDRHPQYPHVVITAGFSGHGFKFSSVVGEIASQLVTEGKTDLSIDAFSLNRFLRV